MKCSLRNPQKAQKKWLAGAAANHLSDSPAFSSPTATNSKTKQHQKPKQIANEEDRLPTRSGQVPPVLLSRKGAAAAAVARRIGILKNESLPHERLFVFERGAVQVQKAFGINEEAGAKFLEDLVAVASLRVQPHGIRETGAAATLYAHAQAADIRRHTFLCKQHADF